MMPQRQQFPGSTGTIYLASLPLELRDNPNCARAITPELYDDVVNGRTTGLQDKNRIVNAFSRLQPLTLRAIDALGHPYHGKRHTEEVIECVTILARFSDQAINVPLLKLGALQHDDGRSRNMYRQLTKDAVRADLSNEEYAALITDQKVRPFLPVAERVELQGYILATSYGQLSPPDFPSLSATVLHRPYKPHSPSEKLLAFADIGRFILGTEAHLNGSLRMLEESDKIPENFEKWIVGEKKLVDYIATRIDDIKPLITGEGFAFIKLKYSDLLKAFETIETGQSNYRQQFETTCVQMRTSTAGV